MNPIQIIQADQQTPQPWRNGGGETRELLVWPPAEKDNAHEAAGNNAQDWLLRISRADISQSGPFSAFPGVQRWFVVLSGNGVVLHMPTSDGHTLDHALQPGHAPLHFDGGLTPGCTLINGPTQDFNLMARGGDAIVLPVNPNAAWTSHHTMRGLYTAGSGTWTHGQQARSLTAHTLVWLEQAGTAPMRFAPDDTTEPQAWWLGYTPEASV